MATQPTNNPIPSESPRDLKFNAGKLDQIVNSNDESFADRFGRARLTWAGIENITDVKISQLDEKIRLAIISSGFTTVDSFEKGFTLSEVSQALRYESTGEYYRWDGPLPKAVPAGSTPQSTGGVGVGAWISVGDASLRTGLSKPDGSSLIGYGDNTLYSSLFNTAAKYGAVGDGITDQASKINAALSDSKGKKLYIAAGIYLVGSPIKIPSNCHLIMDPACVIKRMSYSQNIVLMNDSDGVSGGYSANENITIEGGVIDGNYYHINSECTLVGIGHATNISIKNVSFINAGGRWHALELNGVSRANVEGCYFFNGGGNSDSGEALQLDLMSSSNNDVFPWFGPYDNTFCTDIVIRNNYFDNWATGVGSHTSLSGATLVNLKVLDNTMNVSRLGVSIIGWSGAVISRNRIVYKKMAGYDDNDDFKGIVIIPSPNKTNSDVLISSNHIIYEKQLVNTNNSRGIFTASNTTEAAGRYQNVMIDSNEVRGSFRAHISADNCASVSITSNRINQLGTYGSGVNYAGISCFGSDACVVNNNQVSIFGISANKGNAASVGSLVATGNLCDGGIVCSDFARVSLIANICSSITGDINSARDVGKYRSQFRVCIGNVETSIVNESQIV